METFALAAISFTIAISLLIRKKKNPLYISFAGLCLAIFLQKAGTFLSGLSPRVLFGIIHTLGALSVPPLLVAFTRLFSGRDFLPKRAVVLTAAGSFIILAAFLFPFGEAYRERLSLYYILVILSGCFLALLLSIKGKAAAADRETDGLCGRCLRLAGRHSVSRMFFLLWATRCPRCPTWPWRLSFILFW